MILEIITPEKEVFKGEVEVITLPGRNGMFQVLNGHAPMVSTLKDGVLSIEEKKGKLSYQIEGGVLKIENNIAMILADSTVE